MYRILGVLLAALIILGVGSHPALAESATERVTTVLSTAMDIQTRPDLSGESHKSERAKLIRQLISDSFLSTEMARDSLGRNWDKLSQGQRSEFQSLFSRLFQDSYTRMVLNFLKKESIEYPGESSEGKGAFVKTVIMRANEHIPVDYHLLQKNGRWYIKDVDIDEVSIVNNYRESFQRAIQSGSVDSLIQKMRVQSQALVD